MSDEDRKAIDRDGHVQVEKNTSKRRQQPTLSNLGGASFSSLPMGLNGDVSMDSSRQDASMSEAYSLGDYSSVVTNREGLSNPGSPSSFRTPLEASHGPSIGNAPAVSSRIGPSSVGTFPGDASIVSSYRGLSNNDRSTIGDVSTMGGDLSIVSSERNVPKGRILGDGVSTLRANSSIASRRKGISKSGTLLGNEPLGSSSFRGISRSDHDGAGDNMSIVSSRKGLASANGSVLENLTPHTFESPQRPLRAYSATQGVYEFSDRHQWNRQPSSSVTSESQMQEFDIVVDHDNASMLSGLDYSIVSGRRIPFGSINGDSKIMHKTTMPALPDSASEASSEDALVSLARAMREQAAVIQAMAGQSDGDELSRLAIEKRDLARQVLALQQEIEKMGGSRPSSVASYSSRGSGRLSARSTQSQRRYSFGTLGNIPEVVSADEMTGFSSSRGTSIPGNMAIHGDSYRVGSLHTDDLTDGDMSTIPSFDGASVRSGGSKRSKGSRVSYSSRPSRASRNSLSRKSRMTREGFEPDLSDYVRPESPPGSQVWRSLAFFITFFIPDAIIPSPGAGAKQAWREKVVLCLIMFLSSALVVGGIGFLPIYFCRNSYVYSKEDIWQQHGESWIVIFGKVYDMKQYVDRHLGGRDGIIQFLGNDATKLFPRLPPVQLPNFCLNPKKGQYFTDNRDPVCTEFTDLDIVTNLRCHDSLVGLGVVRKYMEDYKTGDLVIPRWKLGNNEMQWIRVGKSIYNVTQYVNGLIDEKTKEMDFNVDHPNAYLSPELHRLVTVRLNSDVTSVYDELFGTGDLKVCLDELFYEADYDDRSYPACDGVGVMMYLFLFGVTAVLAVQVLCSLVFVFRKPRTFTMKDMEAGIIVMVPCYNEGPHELQKTIDSVVMAKYPEENRVMIVVADGVITGAGNRMSTPAILSDLLGFEMDLDEDSVFHYRSLGKMRNNFACVYTGVYEKEVEEETKSLNYVVVVKRGGPEEEGSNRAGNRGKRDSQLILLGMYNRIHHNRKPSELDIAIVKALFSLGLPAKDVEYLMAIDADTRVDEKSIAHMVYSMEHDKKVLACCGETQVDNKAQSWVTTIQVYEYYSSHHLKKAFESLFGCVTCLPGCFTMYRILTTDMRPLIGHDEVYQDYARNDIPSLHEKNLYELGEDRMLTTLLLRCFPGMRLSFVPEAVCWTIVPHNMDILLSQRRRWINSTFHNMYELLKIQNMCGIFCCSMKVVVFMDLVITMILPASLVYISYLMYLFITEPQSVDRFVLIFYAITFSLQMVSFLSRSRWDYLLWFLCFCVLGIPVFYFILPIYAFAKMDDFSWGRTRTVDDKAAASATTADGENSATSVKEEESDEDEDASEGLSSYFSSLGTPSTALMSNVNRTGSVAEIQFDDLENEATDRSVKTWSPGGVEMAIETKTVAISLPMKRSDDNMSLSTSSSSLVSKLTTPSVIDPKQDFDTFRCLI